MLDTFYEGLATVLAWFYDLTRSYGFSIVLLTLAVRILVTPLTIKGTRSMMAMQEFQPEIKRLQQEYKGDRQRLNEEMLKFYRENNINPMGSCLPLLIQLPVFFVLYQVVRGMTSFGDNGNFDPRYVPPDSALYTSLSKVREMNFLGIDLARSAADTLRDSVVDALPYLAIIAVVTVTSYIQQRQVAGRNPSAMINPMQKNLMRLMPIMFAFFSFSFPAALGLYFVTSNLWQVGQQWYISRHLYGIRRGQLPPESKVVTTTATEKPKPSSGSTKASGTSAGADKARRVEGSGKGAAKPRSSGRVTEPKRPKQVDRPSRPSPGRRSPTGGSGAAGTSPNGSGGKRRRAPFGADNGGGGSREDNGSGPSEPDGPQKKRRS